MEDRNRRTGRTTRAIAKALDAALEGKHAIFVAPTEGMLRSVVAPMLDEMLHHDRGVMHEHRGKRTEISGLGRIDLVALCRLDEQIQGITDPAIFYDHTCSHAVAMEFRNARERMQVARKRMTAALEAVRAADVEMERARDALEDADRGMRRAQERLHDVVAQDETFGAGR